MKVLLTKDVSGLGRAGDVKEVSDGHARNFLIPKHLALPATSSMLIKVQKEEQERQQKLAKQLEQLQQLKNKLEGKTIVVKGRAEAGKQHLFGSIHEKEIAQAVNEKFGTTLEPNQIILEKTVKNLGVQEVEIKLKENIKLKIKVDVQPL